MNYWTRPSQLCIFPTVHRTQYAVHYTQYTVCCTLYTVHSMLYTVHSTQYAVHCTQYAVHCTQDTVSCTLYTVHSMLYTVHSTLYKVHNKQYTIYSTVSTSVCVSPAVSVKKSASLADYRILKVALSVPLWGVTGRGLGTGEAFRRGGWVHLRLLNLLKSSDHYMYRQFNIQKFHVLPTQL